MRQCKNLKEIPKLPKGIPLETVITDYLRGLGKVIKKRIQERWGGVNQGESTESAAGDSTEGDSTESNAGKFQYPDQVRFVVTVPVEWTPDAKGNMLTYLAAADVIPDRSFPNVEFITESEAAAIHCLNISDEYNLTEGDTYIVLDCGGGTCDATTRQILEDNKIGEVSESDASTPGGNSVDVKFLKLLANRIGIDAGRMDEIRQKNYKVIRNLIHHIFWPVKFAFDGDSKNFRTFRVDIEDDCPKLRRLAQSKRSGKNHNWVATFSYEDIKNLFDKAVDGVLSLLRRQIAAAPRHEIKTVFLVGGFGASPYLRKRIEDEFGKSNFEIVVPKRPLSAVMRGAIDYGLNFETKRDSPSYGVNKTVESRILRNTYGVLAFDPISLLLRGIPIVFSPIARRGDRVKSEKTFTEEYMVEPHQPIADLSIYYTHEYDADKEEEVKVLKPWKAKLDDPPAEKCKPRKIEVSLAFEPTPKASAKNASTGKVYEITDLGAPGADRF
jgi:hypothetical protein